MRRAELLVPLALLVACTAPPADPVKGEAKATASTSALPPLDKISAGQVVAALRSVSADNVAPIATQGLAELEVSRLPLFLIEAMTAMASSPPDQRAVVVARALDSVPGQMAWIQACRGGLKVLEGMASVAPAERGGFLWKECSLVDHRLVDEAAVKRADPVLVVLAHLAHDHLRRNGEVAPEERELLIAMMAPMTDPKPAGP